MGTLFWLVENPYPKKKEKKGTTVQQRLTPQSTRGSISSPHAVEAYQHPGPNQCFLDSANGIWAVVGEWFLFLEGTLVWLL